MRLPILLPRIFQEKGLLIDLDRGFELTFNRKKGNENAPLAPAKVNLRGQGLGGTLRPETLEGVGSVLSWRALNSLIIYDAVAGIPNAGLAIARAFLNTSGRSDIPLVEMAKEERGGKIHFVVPPAPDNLRGKRVLLLDDVLHMGETKMKAAEALRQAGYIVGDLLVFGEWGVGGIEQLYTADGPITVHFVITVAELIRSYRSFVWSQEDATDEGRERAELLVQRLDEYLEQMHQFFLNGRPSP